MKFITDTTAKAAVTGGVVFALAVNLGAPFAVKRLEPGPTRQSYTVAAVKVIDMKPHFFEVGSLNGGVQWVQVDGRRFPVTRS